MRFLQVFSEALLLGNKVHDGRKKENTEQSGGQSQLLEFKSSLLCLTLWEDFPGGSDGKVSAYNEGDLGSIPKSGRSPGEGNGNPLRYSCLEYPMDRGTL